jgi:hypothetical protein
MLVSPLVQHASSLDLQLALPQANRFGSLPFTVGRPASADEVTTPGRSALDVGATALALAEGAPALARGAGARSSERGVVDADRHATTNAHTAARPAVLAPGRRGRTLLFVNAMGARTTSVVPRDARVLEERSVLARRCIGRGCERCVTVPRRA